jgi:hypothetical protein
VLMLGTLAACLGFYQMPARLLRRWQGAA